MLKHQSPPHSGGTLLQSTYLGMMYHNTPDQMLHPLFVATKAKYPSCCIENTTLQSKKTNKYCEGVLYSTSSANTKLETAGHEKRMFQLPQRGHGVCASSILRCALPQASPFSLPIVNFGEWGRGLCGSVHTKCLEQGSPEQPCGFQGRTRPGAHHRERSQSEEVLHLLTYLSSQDSFFFFSGSDARFLRWARLTRASSCILLEFYVNRFCFSMRM